MRLIRTPSANIQSRPFFLESQPGGSARRPDAARMILTVPCVDSRCHAAQTANQSVVGPWPRPAAAAPCAGARHGLSEVVDVTRVMGMIRWCSVLSKSHLMVLNKGRTVVAPNSERNAAQITNLHLALPQGSCCQSGELLPFNLVADRCYLPG